MFYRGMIHSYDPETKTGNIKLIDQNEYVDFELEDIANPEIALQIGEQLKFIVLNKGTKQFAKFIIRLDHKQVAEHDGTRLHTSGQQQITHTPSTKINSDIDQLIAKHFRQQNTTGTAEVVATAGLAQINFGDALEMKQPLTEVIQPAHNKVNSQYPLLDESNVIHEEEAVTKMEKQTQFQNREVPLNTEKQARPRASGTIWDQPLPEVKTAFQLQFNAQKIISPSKYEHIQDFRSQYTKAKKTATSHQFNPWILASIVPILVVINLGMWGLQKYQTYNDDQQTKARLYSIEQQQIIKKQKEIADQR